MKKSLFLFLTLYAQAQDSLNLHVVARWYDPNLSFNQWGYAYTDVWGYTANGREYAFLGSIQGVYIIDITDSAQIQLVDFVPGPYSTHRDMKTYRNYLYIVTDGFNNYPLQIVDLSPLPDSVSLVYESDSLISTTHNIFIDTAQAILYTCVGTDTNGVSYYSLANPEQPIYLGTFVQPASGFYDCHDLYVRNDSAYINGGSDGLFIVSFSSNPPQIKAHYTNYPYAGYNHSGWLSEDGTTYVMIDEDPGSRVKIVDVSNWTAPSTISLVFSMVDTFNSMAHNPMLIRDTLYISHYADGLYVFDLSNPSSPALLGYYDTSPLTPDFGFVGAWGVYAALPSRRILVSDMQLGLFVLNWGVITKTTAKKQTKMFFTKKQDKLIFYFSRPTSGKIEIWDWIGKKLYSNSIHNEQLHEVTLLNQEKKIIVRFAERNGNVVVRKYVFFE